MDKSRFQLLSGSSALDCLTNDDFETIQNIMEQRLLDSLCLTESPTDDALWEQLLADALSISVLVKQDQGLQSESMRNYSYQLRDYANTWEMLSQRSNDLLKKFNNCATGITFQTDIAARIYGYDHRYGCQGCDECI